MINYIIPVKGELKAVYPKNGSKFSLKELQEFVGGFIELVTVPGEKFVVCNEYGKIENLPVNKNATEAFKSSLMSGDTLNGDIAVISKEYID